MESEAKAVVVPRLAYLPINYSVASYSASSLTFDQTRNRSLERYMIE